MFKKVFNVLRLKYSNFRLMFSTVFILDVNQFPQSYPSYDFKPSTFDYEYNKVKLTCRMTTRTINSIGIILSFYH